MSRWRWTLAASLALLALGMAREVAAVTTRHFELAALKDFEKSELDAVKVSSTGELSLWHASRPLACPEKEVWASLVAPGGQVYFSTGNAAALYRVEKDKAVKVFGADDVAFSCLARAPDGRMIMGAVPSGKLYAVDAAGKGTVLATLPAPYVWSLAIDKDGTIYAGTGPEGVVYAVGKDGAPRVHYDTRDGNILALALSPEGELWAGSAQKGILYRIPRAQEGHVEGDFGGKEVRALRFRGATLYIALNEGQSVEEPAGEVGVSRLGAEFTRLGRGLTHRFAGTETSGDEQEESQPQSLLRGASGGTGARVDMMGPEGRLETVASFEDGSIMDLAAQEDGLVLVALGHPGRVMGVRPGGEQYLLAAVPQAQAVSLALDQGRLAFIGCANPGSGFVVDAAPAPRGLVTLKPLDAEFPSAWGEIRWDGHGGVAIATRSGNTRNPDHTWSGWGAATGGRPARIASPSGRYLQVRLTWGDDPGALVRDLACYYHPQNQRPVVERIDLGREDEKAGLAQEPVDGGPQDAPSSSSRMRQAIDALGLGEAGGKGDRSDLEAEGSRRRGMLQRGDSQRTPREPPGEQGRGMPEREERPHSPIRMVRWSAVDKDGDTLVYRLFLRGEDDDVWVNLTPREPLTGSMFAWNTESVPDGRYVLKVVASDERANAPESALAGEKTSAPFLVDNTRPKLEASLDERDRTIRGTARDDLSPIARLELSIDGQEWTPVEPTDKILDKQVEAFVAALPDLAPGAHAVAVRAADAEGNVGSVRLIVRIRKP